MTWESRQIKGKKRGSSLFWFNACSVTLSLFLLKQKPNADTPQLFFFAAWTSLCRSAFLTKPNHREWHKCWHFLLRSVHGGDYYEKIEHCVSMKRQSTSPPPSYLVISDGPKPCSRTVSFSLYEGHLILQQTCDIFTTWFNDERCFWETCRDLARINHKINKNHKWKWHTFITSFTL